MLCQHTTPKKSALDTRVLSENYNIPLKIIIYLHELWQENRANVWKWKERENGPLLAERTCTEDNTQMTDFNVFFLLFYAHLNGFVALIDVWNDGMTECR